MVLQGPRHTDTATLTLGVWGDCGACRSFLGWTLQGHRAVSAF